MPGPSIWVAALGGLVHIGFVAGGRGKREMKALDHISVDVVNPGALITAHGRLGACAGVSITCASILGS